jgi:hypothetical protein
MYCRKKLNHNIRCPIKINDLSCQGYCSEHWALYQLGVEYHDPTQDFDLEDAELFDMIQQIEESQFFEKESKDSGFFLMKKSEEFLDIKDLNKFSKDKQNVHTSPMVKRTLNIANILIDIAKKNYCEDSLVEFLHIVNLSEAVKDNLMNYYFSESSIYDLVAPTFKIVFDGLWIYIKKQKIEIQRELIKILAQELNDNVETCAQGNLSRLTNVLSGYIDQPVMEVSLQDSMSEISKEKDTRLRLSKAKKELEKRHIKGEEYHAWLDAMDF